MRFVKKIYSIKLQTVTLEEVFDKAFQQNLVQNGRIENFV